jgi:hypothetical protein
MNNIFLIKRLWKKHNAIRFMAIMWKLFLWKYQDKGTLSTFYMLELDEKNRKRKSFITYKEFLHLHDRLNPIYHRPLLEDKYIFDRFMKGFGFPVAKTLGYLMGDEVYWIDENKRESVENIVNRNLDCYVKLFMQWGGKDIFKLSIRQGKILVNNEPSDLSAIRSFTKCGIYVIQNRIQQHPMLDQLNSACVNTIRMITIDNGHAPQNFYNFIRIGVNGRVIDNLASGGLGCGIHADGTLYDTASDTFFNHFRITHHPDTNVAFKTFRIPHYHQALELVVKMHHSLHCFFMVAWDVAITEEGPVILEANPLAGYLFEQSIYGPFREEILQHAKHYERNKLIHIIGENQFKSAIFA